MRIREFGKVTAVGGKVLLLTLAIGFSARVEDAKSYTLPTIEIPGASLFAQILSQLNTAAQKVQDKLEYYEQKMRWLRTLQQFQQALIQVQAAINSFGLPTSPMMTPVAENYLVAEKCGGNLDFSLSSMISTFVLDLDGDIKSQQQKVCASIQMMQNRKFNDSVNFMNETLPSMTESLLRVLSIRLVSNDQGQVQGADSESLRLANDLAVQSQAWQARMQAYDAYISTMTQNQNILATKALKGKNSLVSNLVKTAALKTALSID